MPSPALAVRLLYFNGCPSWRVTVGRLREALAGTGRAGTVECVSVESADPGTVALFAGSPTLIVNGRDLFPGTEPATELTCRLYPGPAGLRGSPSVQSLIEALTGSCAVESP